MKTLNNFFKKLFRISPEEQIVNVPEKLLDLASVNIFDDVWIKVGSNIFSGWVVERNNGILYIVYTDGNKKLQDAVFKIERPLNRTEITQNEKTLLLIKPK